MTSITKTIRIEFGESDAKRDAGLTTPEEIVRYDNLQYGADKEWQLLDVYRPRCDEGIKLPVIVSIHGGAFVYGNKEVYQFYCMDLAKRGFAIVNFTYRLAPEFKFPAGLCDTNLVIDWIFEHADEYNFDTKNIFMVGDSAGGHMLALYSSICTNKEYAKKFDFKVRDGFVPRAIALNCGKYVIDLNVDMDREIMKDYLENGGTEEELELINATKYITDDFPTTFLMTSNKDFLIEQAPLIAVELKKHEIPFVYRQYGTKDNPLWHVFHCSIMTEAAEKCNDDECAFFAANME